MSIMPRPAAKRKSLQRKIKSTVGTNTQCPKKIKNTLGTDASNRGLMMECIRVRECMEINMQCMASSDPIRYSEKVPAQAWLPDTTPHFGVHATFGEWQTMYHALFNVVYDHQGGPRGADKTFLSGMFMAMAQRPLGEGTFGLRAMLSPDPFMGANGYPLIFATGETADGRTHLIDRQHPHDLFMELATTYSYAFNKNSSVYVYAGLPGEPALGPSAFMHRTSGMDTRSANHASLAGQHPHHVWCAHGGCGA
jgi:hypothetical protein